MVRRSSPEQEATDAPDASRSSSHPKSDGASEIAISEMARSEGAKSEHQPDPSARPVVSEIATSETATSEISISEGAWTRQAEEERPEEEEEEGEWRAVTGEEWAGEAEGWAGRGWEGAIAAPRLRGGELFLAGGGACGLAGLLGKLPPCVDGVSPGATDKVSLPPRPPRVQLLSSPQT